LPIPFSRSERVNVVELQAVAHKEESKLLRWSKEKIFSEMLEKMRN